MKKLFVVIAALFVAATANAQFGVIAGVTSTETDVKSAIATAGDITQYHVGAAFRLNLGFLGIQPAVIYNVKGASITETINGTGTSSGSGSAGQSGETTVNQTNQTGFLEVPVQVQFGLPLGGFRPYVFAEPFAGYAITNESTKQVTTAIDSQDPEVKKQNWDNVKSRLEYGIGVGAGIDLFDTFQLSVRYFWNMGQLYDESGKTNINATETLTTVQETKSSGVMASIAFFF